MPKVYYHIANELSKNFGGLTIDLGCGEKQYRPFAERYLGVDLVGIPDVKADALHLPFRDRTVDRVFAVGSVISMNDGWQQEAYRVLKP